MNVEIIHVPIHISHHKMDRIKDVDDFLHREIALVMKPRAVRVRVGLIEPLALRHQCCVTHRDVAVLVDVCA